MKTRDSGGRRGAVKGASLPLLSLFEFKCFSVCVCMCVLYPYLDSG